MSATLQQALANVQAPDLQKIKANDAKMVAIGKQLTDLQMPIAPAPKTVPDVPPIIHEQPLKALSSLGALIGIFGSLKTLQPLTSALNAGAEALRGGQMHTMEQNAEQQQTWMNQFKAALDQNAAETAGYRDAVEKYHNDQSALMAQLRVLSAENKDPMMEMMVHTGDVKQVYHHIAMKEKAGDLANVALSNVQQSMHGDAFLKTLPAATASIVKMLSEGSIPLSPYNLRKPYWVKLMVYAHQYDPSFDANQYETRAKTRLEFTSGKAATAINAANTLLAHLGKLQQSVIALHNTSYPMANWIKNQARTAVGAKALKTFNLNKDTMVRELTRLYRGTGGSEAEVKDFGADLSSASSPNQFQGVLRRMAHLIVGRLDALSFQYQQGMGKQRDPLTFLNPQAAQVLQGLLGPENNPQNEPATAPWGGGWQPH